MRVLAIILIIVGLIMTAFTGFDIITQKDVVDIGPIDIDKEEKTPVYWSPITGMILLSTGLIIFFLGKKGKDD